MGGFIENIDQFDGTNCEAPIFCIVFFLCSQIQPQTVFIPPLGPLDRCYDDSRIMVSNISLLGLQYNVYYSYLANGTP